MALVTRTQPPISKAKSLEFFLFSIKDPHNPRHCAICLDGAFRECSDAEEWEPGLIARKLKNRPNSVPKYDAELWNAIVRFLFVKRTNKQMRRLLISLSECTCRMDQQGGDVQRYHQSSLQRPKKPTADQVRRYNDHYEHELAERQMFIQPWRQFLFNLFLSLSVPIERSGSKSTAKGSSTSWPHSSTDLIPYGADTLVESVLQWYQFIHDPLLFTLMGSIVQVCRELVIPSLAKYKFTKVVVESTKQALDRVMMDHGSINNGPGTEIVGYPIYGSFSQMMDPRPVLLDPEYGANRRPGAFALYVWPWHSMDAMFYLITSLFLVFHDDYKAALFQDCEIKAMQLCSLIIYIFYPLANAKICPRVNYDIEGIVKTGQELYRLFHMQRRFQPDIPVHPFIKDLDDAMYRLDMRCRAGPAGLKALNVLRVFRIDRRCSALGCMNSLQTAGKDFQRCGKCEIVSYCGRDCQKKAWKDEKHPHKRLCPIITNLVEKAGGYEVFLACTRGRADSPANMSATKAVKSNWDKAKVDDGDLKLVTDWDDAVNVSRGFTLLDQRHLSPGFLDYENILHLLSTADGAPKPAYLAYRLPVS